MKKILSLLIILPMIFVSCAQGQCKRSADDIASAVVSKNAIPHMKRYICSATEYTDRYLDKELSEILYGCDIYDHCSDFSIVMCKKDIVSELHVLVAKNEEKSDYLKSKLKERADTLRDKEIYLYDSENAEYINAMVYQKGLYVCLVAGESSEIMYAKLCEILT